jgi:hypothetical protein
MSFRFVLIMGNIIYNPTLIKEKSPDYSGLSFVMFS